MSETKHGPKGDPNGGSNHPGNVPYWKRAHRGWFFWVAVFMMLVAIIVYVMSNDLAGWQQSQPQPTGGAVKKL